MVRVETLAEVQSGWSGWRFARFDDLDKLGQARAVRRLRTCWQDDFDLKKPENQALKSEAIAGYRQVGVEVCVGGGSRTRSFGHVAKW